MVRRKRLHMHLPVPTRPQNLGNARCVGIVALVGTARQRGTHMPGIQANHLKTLRAQPVDQPRRQRPGLQADAGPTTTAGAADRRGERSRIRGASTSPDDIATHGNKT